MKTFGLIGYPLTHSFSKSYFNDKFLAEDIDAWYENFEIPRIEDFKAIIRDTSTLCGLNVTIPYKEQIIPYLDELSDMAREVGAVNVVKISRSKRGIYLKGFNTDVIGFSRSIEFLLKREHKAALILGTGGASKAVEYALKKLGLKTLLVSRNPQEGAIGYGDITPPILDEYKVIVNTTPVGMFPHVDEAPGIPYQFLTSSHLLYDLLYNPAETKFMRLGRERGATVCNGMEMLLLQAEAGWEIWNR